MTDRSYIPFETHSSVIPSRPGASASRGAEQGVTTTAARDPSRVGSANLTAEVGASEGGQLVVLSQAPCFARRAS